MRIPTARFRPDRRPVCSRRRAAPAPVLRFSSAHAPAAAYRAAFAAADGAAAPHRLCCRSAARAFAPGVRAARPAAVPVPDCVQSDSLPRQSIAPHSAAHAAPCGGSRRCSPRASPPSPSPAAASADGRLTFVRSQSAKAGFQTSGWLLSIKSNRFRMENECHCQHSAFICNRVTAGAHRVRPHYR